MAYKGLFDSAHFSGRLVRFDFGNYTNEDSAHRKCWARILRLYSQHLELNPKSLLLDHDAELLYWNNGTVGLLDKHLWQCSVLAKARRKPIDFETIKSCSPPEKERAKIAQDIELGRKALEPASSHPAPFKTKQNESDQGDTKQQGAKQEKDEGTKGDQSKEGGQNAQRKPFERNVNRHPGLEVNLHDDD
jgi:hypothetical protein